MSRRPLLTASRLVAVAAVTACVGVGAPGSAAGEPTIAAAAAPPQRVSELTPSDAVDGDEFGNAVAVSGNVVAVMAPEHLAGSNRGTVYVFTRPAAGWKATSTAAELSFPESSGEDASTVAISGDTIAIGDGNFSDTDGAGVGAIFVYSKPAAGWKTTSHPTATLTADDGAAADQLGLSVAVSGDTIVAGAPDQDTGAEADRGAAYVFSKPPGGWTTTTQTAELTGTTGAADDEFGSGVAVSGDTIVVGAPEHTDGGLADAGLGYVFVKPTEGAWVDAVQNRKLEASDAAAGDEFGGSSAVAIAGGTIVIGTTLGYPQTRPGVAYEFTRPAAGWGAIDTLGVLTETAKLTASDGATGDSFASSVSITGSGIVVSAPDKKVGTTVGAGAAYLFTKPASGWATATESSKLVSPHVVAEGVFGRSVAISGTTVAIGAAFETPGGVAYVRSPVAPALAKVKESKQTWTLGKKPTRLNPAHKPKGGTTLSFTLNEAAPVALSFREKVHGHLKHRGTVTVNAKPGHNIVFFDGKISHAKTLPAGHYTVTITAKNANGAATPKTLHFRAVKPKKR